MKKAIFNIIVFAVIVIAGKEYIMKPVVEMSGDGQHHIEQKRESQHNQFEEIFE